MNPVIRLWNIVDADNDDTTAGQFMLALLLLTIISVATFLAIIAVGGWLYSTISGWVTAVWFVALFVLAYRKATS